MNTKTDRPRGVTVYPMPREVCGPFDNYALMSNSRGDLRMVHSEGVSYSVTVEKPWRWNDYDPKAKTYDPASLIDFATLESTPVDLADWVRTFGDRLEGNFHQNYRWGMS